MSIQPSGSGIYFIIPIFGGIAVTETLLSILLTTLILCICGVRLGKGLQKRPGRMQVLAEKGVGTLYHLVSETMGAHNAHWAPFIGTIFLSSVIGTFLGMTGFIRPATADLSVVLTWSVAVSAIIWYQSIKANGFLGWLKGFTEPIAVMTPMNLVSEVAQPISMAFRHFGNIAGGGVINSVLYAAMALLSSALIGLISGSGIAVAVIVTLCGVLLLWFGLRKKKLMRKVFGAALLVLGVFSILQATGILTGIPILQVGLPAILSLYFDVFSGVIQAFVFSLLTMIYIAGACPPPEESGSAA